MELEAIAHKHWPLVAPSLFSLILLLHHSSDASISDTSHVFILLAVSMLYLIYNSLLLINFQKISLP